MHILHPFFYNHPSFSLSLKLLFQLFYMDFHFNYFIFFEQLVSQPNTDFVWTYLDPTWTFELTILIIKPWFYTSLSIKWAEILHQADLEPIDLLCQPELENLCKKILVILHEPNKESFYLMAELIDQTET